VTEIRPFPRYHFATTWDAENEEHVEIDFILTPDGHVRWEQRDRTIEN
jgi:hypothetical protein